MTGIESRQHTTVFLYRPHPLQRACCFQNNQRFVGDQRLVLLKRKMIYVAPLTLVRVVVEHGCIFVSTHLSRSIESLSLDRTRNRTCRLTGRQRSGCRRLAHTNRKNQTIISSLIRSKTKESNETEMAYLTGHARATEHVGAGRLAARRTARRSINRLMKTKRTNERDAIRRTRMMQPTRDRRNLLSSAIRFSPSVTLLLFRVTNKVRCRPGTCR